ncbi:hypothetical protein GPNCGGLF_LOCUS3157 [Methylorubrum aminovorans]
MHARVQPEIGYELIRAGEPRHGSDGGDQPDGDHQIDAWDCHQPRDVRVGAGLARQFTLDDLHVLTQPVVLAQVPGDGIPLVPGQRLCQQPGPSPRPKQIGVGTGRHEMRMQDRLHHRLQPRPLQDDLGAACDLAPERKRCLVRDPDLRQKATGIEPRQHGRVDDVGLDPRLGDQPHLARVGDHHPADMRPDHLRDRAGVAGRLDHDMIVVRQRLGERRQVIARHADPTKTPDRAVFEHHRLGENAVDVQSHNPHEPVSSSRLRELAGNTATTDPRSQRIRASRRGGQITAWARSPSSKGRPARTHVLPVPRVPDGLTIAPIRRSAERDGTEGHHAG